MMLQVLILNLKVARKKVKRSHGTPPPDLRPIIASAHAVSDRSFKDKFGTSAFPAIGARARSILSLKKAVPGHPEDKGACRSKLAGLFAVIFLVNLTCSWAGIAAGTVSKLAATVYRLLTKPSTPGL